MRGAPADDLDGDAEGAGGGLGAGAGGRVVVHGQDRRAEAGGLDGERAAAGADVPDQVAGAGAEAGELGGAQAGELALAGLLHPFGPGGPVGLGGQGPAAYPLGVGGLSAA